MRDKRLRFIYRVPMLLTFIAILLAYGGLSPANASVENLFFCESKLLGSITINMNFGEWFDDQDHRGDVEFGKKHGTYEIDYKGMKAQLIHRGTKSRMLFADGSVLILACDKGASGQTPGQ